MNMDVKKSRRIIWCLGLFILLTLLGCKSDGGWGFGGNQVLFVNILNDDNRQESSGIKAFQEALVIGGQVSITRSEVASQYPEYEKFSPSNLEGKFYINGAIANFICSKGWHYHSTELGGILVFVK